MFQGPRMSAEYADQVAGRYPQVDYHRAAFVASRVDPLASRSAVEAARIAAIDATQPQEDNDKTRLKTFRTLVSYLKSKFITSLTYYNELFQSWDEYRKTYKSASAQVEMRSCYSQYMIKKTLLGYMVETENPNYTIISLKSLYYNWFLFSLPKTQSEYTKQDKANAEKHAIDIIPTFFDRNEVTYSERPLPDMSAYPVDFFENIRNNIVKDYDEDDYTERGLYTTTNYVPPIQLAINAAEKNYMDGILKENNHHFKYAENLYLFKIYPIAYTAYVKAWIKKTDEWK